LDADLTLGQIAARLELPLSDAQLSALARFGDLLLRWNAAYNLTAVRRADEVLSLHLADCLAVVPALQRHRPRGRLLDVGSGGGLPGAVIAIAAPGWNVFCVDSVGKKTAFIRDVAGVLQLTNLEAVHSRVEALRSGSFDVITSRAFSSLETFTRQTQALLAPGGVWMAMKGKVPHDEIAGLHGTLDVFHVEPLNVPGLNAQRCLVWMSPNR
jgi:16S rRNA (guanine527-N7)-methyltransferase